MTRIFVDGKNVPVTVLQFQDSSLICVRDIDNKNYQKVQIGSLNKTKITKPLLGHIKKNLKEEIKFRKIIEFKLSKNINTNELDISFDSLKVGDFLKLTGYSKGKGFTGVIKRHGFGGQPASRGHDHIRAPGSIGSRWPQRTFAGKKMAGRTGNEKITINKAKILDIDNENKLIFVSTSVPGSNNNYLQFSKIFIEK